MPCNDCGECRYASDSTATLRRTITSNGIKPECKPDKESLFTGLSYESPGIWSKTYPDGRVVRVRSKCISGSWDWALTEPRGDGQRDPTPPPGCALPAPSNVITQFVRNDCGGYHAITLSTYPDGKWIREEVIISVENNAECE